jgi:hypothetical protein
MRTHGIRNAQKINRGGGKRKIERKEKEREGGRGREREREGEGEREEYKSFIRKSF